MDDKLAYVSEQIPFLQWKIEDNLLIAKSGSLKFRIVPFGTHHTECSIYNLKVGRNIFVHMDDDFNNVVNSLKSVIIDLAESLKGLKIGN